MTGVLIRRVFGYQGRYTEREEDMKRLGEKTAIYKPRKEAWKALRRDQPVDS